MITCVQFFAVSSTYVFTLEHEKICKHCVNKFDNENDVREHMNRTHGEKLYTCDHCEQAFKWEYLLKKHMRNMPKERNTRKIITGIKKVQVGAN